MNSQNRHKGIYFLIREWIYRDRREGKLLWGDLCLSQQAMEVSG